MQFLSNIFHDLYYSYNTLYSIFILFFIFIASLITNFSFFSSHLSFLSYRSYTKTNYSYHFSFPAYIRVTGAMQLWLFTFSFYIIHTKVNYWLQFIMSVSRFARLYLREIMNNIITALIINIQNLKGEMNGMLVVYFESLPQSNLKSVKT